MPAPCPVRILTAGDLVQIDGVPAVLTGVHPHLRGGDERRDQPRTFEVCWQRQTDWQLDSAVLPADWELELVRTAAELVSA